MSLIEEWRTDYYDLWINIKFEFLKNWERKRTIIAVSVTLLTSLLFYLIPKLTGSEYPEASYEFLANSMNFVNLVLILNAILFGSDAINGEHATKTVLLIYPLPQRRLTIIVAKYLTQLVTAWFVISLYYAIVGIEVILIYGFEDITTDLISSLVFAYLYMGVLMAFAFFLSGLVKSPAISMVMFFFSILLLFPIIIMMFVIADVETSWIFTNYANMITLIFRFPASISLSGVQTDPNLQPELIEGVIVCGISLLIFISTAIGLELRREV